MLGKQSKMVQDWPSFLKSMNYLVNFHYIPIKIVTKIYTSDLTFTSPNVIRRI